MACEEFNVYTIGPIPRTGVPTQGTSINSFGSAMEIYPALYVDAYGGDCVAAKEALLSTESPPGYSFPNLAYPRVVQTGAIIDKPGEANVFPASTVDPLNSVRLSIKNNGATVGSMTWTWDVVTGTVVFTDSMPAEWDAVIGVNSTGVEWVAVEGAFTLTQTVPIITDYDFDEYWCCSTVAYECCGAPPSLFYGGKFSIPPPAAPTPEQEKSSVPITNTPLYLSNHTFQFINNYGRVK